MPLLEVRDLRTSFFLEGGEARAVDGVSFALDAGRVLGLVGESGCGKSVTALSLMRLVPPPGRIVGGEVRLDGRDLLGLPEREMRAVRGAGRSEEHTSELQSQSNLVCRLLLEKKKKTITHTLL